ncbi:MAG: type II toxin-antitoxin system RelE/ParE family toxin [Rhizobiales bacterium]|nr:type II toxin-antitoxin system RelE/ParE family toxin [Hyphomicrobiales bacterium]OJY07483.1 MAG: Killer protein [Rhizobiales bacterium 63-22]
MIRSYRDKTTAAIAGGKSPKGFPPDLIKAARRKLVMLDNAAAIDDLKSPPGNKLHPLFKDRAGQHAIWINDQFRLCFRWTDAGPEDVEITDYHD